MATKKKTRQKRITRSFDVERKIGKLEYADGNVFEYALLGLPEETLFHLALVGAGEILSRRQDPKEAWENIKQGHFGRGGPKPVPITVKALHLLGNRDGGKMSEDEALELWERLSKAEREEIRKDPGVLSAVKIIQAGELARKPSIVSKFLPENAPEPLSEAV